MKVKDKLKKIFITINPTYRKTLAIQEQVSSIKKQLARIESNITNYHIQTRTMLWWLQSDEPTNAQNAQKEFWSKYPKATGDMRIVQTGNMYILNSLKKICDDNGLKFWLHGGTLIGAMRHNGFIPWDDDVDVAMMRSDICKLFEVLEDNEEFQLNTYYHDNNTFSRGYQFKLKNLEIPNFVDIFVFDYCQCESKNDEKEHFRKFSIVRGGMIKKFMALSPRPVALDIGCHHWGPFKSEDAIVANKLIDEGLKIMGDITKGNCVYYAIDNYPFSYPIIPIEKIFPTIMHDFENTEFAIPANPELYLQGYGDYWQAPRDIENAPHFYYYEPYINDIKEFLMNHGFDVE